MYDNSIKVVVYKFGTSHIVDRYESCAQAAKALYIRSPDTIYQYLHKHHKRAKRGIGSYKTSDKYHFEYDK